MHQYLRAIGFEKVNNRKSYNELIQYVVENAQVKKFTQIDETRTFAEYSYIFAEGIGICVRGEYEDDHFFMDYAFPLFIGSQISSYADNSVERHAEKESYAGICEDVRVGVSLIFYLQNVSDYLKRKIAGQLPMKGTALTLSGLSTSGTILLPIKKNEYEVEKTKKLSYHRQHLILKARNGDEEAIETLSLEDMDTYSNISKMIVKEDVLTLVDNYFMPYGVECDQFSVLGEILELNSVINKITNEKIWEMTISCNDLVFDVCINSKDLFGEPKVGRRFKGTIWLQGNIHFPV